MKRTSFLYLWLVLALLGAGIGCGKKPDDTKISSEIQGKFSQDSGLSAKQLTVQASNGVVTLGGTVDSDAQREAASRQAASVAGVKEVVNNLQGGSAPQTAAVAAPAATEIANAPAPPTVRPDRDVSGRRKSKKDRVAKISGEADSSANDSNSSQD